MSGSATPVYAHGGLRIRSEVELHLPFALDGRWDVDVRRGRHLDECHGPPPGEVIAEYQMGGTSWYTATDTGSGYRLRFEGAGEFEISADLSTVEVRALRAGPEGLLPILLAGTVSAFLLALRGHTALHASAVAIDGTAVAFVGQSGRGKSTLAALLCVHGAALVTDDVLTIDTEVPVRCTGGATELRLRAPAAALVPTHAEVRTRRTADERVAYAPSAAPPVPLPLGAIVVPAPSRSDPELVVARLDPSSALFTLLSFPRVYGWRRPDVLERDFGALSHLVNHVPVYVVTVPWGPPFDPAVARSLAALATDGPAVPERHPRE